MENTEELPFRISSTVKALSSALRGEPGTVAEAGSLYGGGRGASEPEKLWFKESSAKNLRNRDFLSPTTVLTTLFADGQVPPHVMDRVLSAGGSGVLPIAGGEVIGEGLRLRVDHAVTFRDVLCGTSRYIQPSCKQQGGVVLNCPALYPRPSLLTPDTLTLGQLRTVLLADHLGALLQRQGYSISRCPVLPEDCEIVVFLKLLGVDWPTVSVGSNNVEREEELWQALQNSPYREEEEEAERGKSRGEEQETETNERRGDGKVAVKINLKRVLEKNRLQGYDPNLGTYTVQRDSVSQLAQLQKAVMGFQVPVAAVVHVTSCQDEFRQQQMAMLWRAGGATFTQKHLVCGPVKTPGSQLSATQYIQLRRVQMKEASEMKYGAHVEGQAWDDIIKVMTSATVRFELLSTAHTSPVTLDVQREGGVSTKGPRGGVFVMYNCARLHTLFNSYERAVEQGLYPKIPDGSQLDFSALKEEGEWLLLFNYLIPFSELLDQSGQALEQGGEGARVSLRTEQVCRFLVSLSKDFSSYYNRVHVLGEPMPHLFNQMFCRLQLLSALRELYHYALDTLHIPPIPQL
ncbi:DALR anticodon-binding domain-containing protein 3 [Megalops cyprinoides]|uniref:DALR anticodon-binding domain-containing protein 3 n=1 Tax=Megalops cyprinoides TaxID=118141 RepID=UPI0018651A0A|nr:DALR anticodon-binding domain-containing protein 3 [Megalops cyprinoides]